MIQRFAVRMIGVAGLAGLAGCGLAIGLPVVPDDCLPFSRQQARTWYADAQAGKSDGDTELEALAAITLKCVQSHCDGTSGGVCAVTCASCADALVAILYE